MGLSDTDPWVIRYMERMESLDEIDLQLLKELLRDASQSKQEIANTIGVSRPTIVERIKKLKDRGIIDHYTLDLNYTNCGLPLRSYILVAFDPAHAESKTQKDVAKLISKLDFVKKVDIITGQYEFLVHIAIDYMESLADIIIEDIRQISGVGSTETFVSFATYQNGFQISKRVRKKRL